MARVLPAKANLIPETAEKVFSGILFDVYQWQQKLFDGSEATFEMLKRPDTVIILAIKDDKLVMIQDEQPGIAEVVEFPGGRLEEGEEWEAGARRELLEETGLTFNKLKLVFVRQPITKIEWFVTFYVASDLAETSLANPDAGEKIKVLYKTLDEAKDILNNKHKSRYYEDILQDVNSIEDILNWPEFVG